MVQELTIANGYDICIIEYIHNTYFLNFIPRHLITILDTHDIVSERGDSLKKIPSEAPLFMLSEERELKLFSYYDYIMLICEPDYQKIGKIIPKEKLLLVPHFCPPVPKETKANATCIGFVGSEYIANKDGLLHFVSTSWPLLRRTRNVELKIFGNIRNVLPADRFDDRIRIEGFIPDTSQIYKEIDIAINPIRYGAGIKIKSVEALAHETPLVTTAHGARGLEKGYNRAFLVADDPKSFSLHIGHLLDDFQYRKTVARRGREFVQQQFSQGMCYQQLISVIYNN
jgi:glycosyltransferase involved in cell wall biosynthesis